MSERLPSEGGEVFMQFEQGDVAHVLNMSRRGAEITLNGLAGVALEWGCLTRLAEESPEDYQEELVVYYGELLERKWNYRFGSEDYPEYIKKLKHLHATEDIGDIPSEPLQEAYFAQRDFLFGSAGYLVGVDAEGVVSHDQAVETWRELHQAAVELEQRGFSNDSEDYTSEIEDMLLNNPGMLKEEAVSKVHLQHSLLINETFDRIVNSLGIASERAKTLDEREKYYLLFKDSINQVSDGFFGDPEIFMFDHARSTPDISIALDICAGLVEVHPENKQYKKFVRHLRRRINPVTMPDAYRGLSDLGKDAARRLGIYSQTDIILGMARWQHEANESMQRY